MLCQIVELEKQDSTTTAHCQIIGYVDKEGKIKRPRIPFEPGSEVFLAEDHFIQQIILKVEQQILVVEQKNLLLE